MNYRDFKYLHEFTNNEPESSIRYEAAECGIEDFEFIVSELVRSNDCVNIFIIQIKYTAHKNRQTLSQLKLWCNDCGVLNLHHGYYTTMMTSRGLFSPINQSENQNSFKYLRLFPHRMEVNLFIVRQIKSW